MTFCVLGDSHCFLDKKRYDSWETAKQAEKFVEGEGNTPHWKNVDGDLVWLYAYGECYKGRMINKADMDMEISIRGGDCNDCVCWDQ